MKPRYWVEDTSEPSGIRPVDQFNVANMRGLALDDIGDHAVSTMFVGNDLFRDEDINEAPAVYETQIAVTFDGVLEEFFHRWRDADEARREHDKIVEYLKTGPRSADEVADWLAKEK